ncbi:hypothetical protein AaE_002877, partial [Aphanomyces astaci]|uniref:Transposase zinc-ribbon domain-containing protein n=1 Tax=Aphanomyces astaci TaxID=112090 RepID=A0A418BNU9_APHAT
MPSPRTARVEAPAAAPSNHPDMYDMSGLEDFSYDEVMRVTQSEEECVKWCIKVGLLRSPMMCPKCAKPMKLRQQRWRCQRSACGSAQLSVKAGSFFANSKIPICKAVRLMFDWASKKAVMTVADEQEVTPRTAID